MTPLHLHLQVLPLLGLPYDVNNFDRDLFFKAGFAGNVDLLDRDAVPQPLAEVGRDDDRCCLIFRPGTGPHRRMAADFSRPNPIMATPASKETTNLDITKTPCMAQKPSRNVEHFKNKLLALSSATSDLLRAADLGRGRYGPAALQAGL